MFRIDPESATTLTYRLPAPVMDSRMKWLASGRHLFIEIASACPLFSEEGVAASHHGVGLCSESGRFGSETSGQGFVLWSHGIAVERGDR